METIHTIEESNWLCEKCSIENNSLKASCEVCLSFKDDSNYWLCPKCNSFNSFNRYKCIDCHYKHVYLFDSFKFDQLVRLNKDNNYLFRNRSNKNIQSSDQTNESNKDTSNDKSFNDKSSQDETIRDVSDDLIDIQVNPLKRKSSSTSKSNKKPINKNNECKSYHEIYNQFKGECNEVIITIPDDEDTVFDILCNNEEILSPKQSIKEEKLNDMNESLIYATIIDYQRNEFEKQVKLMHEYNKCYNTYI